ncbi:MAG: porin [Methylophaga sp.]
MKKTTLATLVGAAAFAAAGAANATIVVGGENGYEFSVDGNINQFFTYADNEVTDAAGNKTDVKNSGVENGLLPTFFGLNVKAPEINGLTIGARVSLSPSTNGGSYPANNFGQGNAMEQREAFATVDGGFGQIMMGKALGLYSSNNILLDQTLFGVGATTGNSNVTTLGRIGYGYDYADWRSQIRWTSNDMSGFKIALAVVDAEQVAADQTENDPRFEGQLSYATAFNGGSTKLWLDGMTQSVETAQGDIDSDAWTLGGQLVLGGFEAVAAYYDNEGVGAAGGLAPIGTAAEVIGGSYEEVEGDGYYAQLGYRFAGQTFVAGSYGESKLDFSTGETENEMWTVGVYHDVTANLKLVAEYSALETQTDNTLAETDTDVFSVGGFISW